MKFTEKDLKFIARIMDEFMNVCSNLMDDETLSVEVHQLADLDFGYAWKILSKIRKMIHE